MECSSKSEVAAVGEGSDDKTTSVAKVLVAIDKLGIDSSDEQLILPIVPTAQVQLETIKNFCPLTNFPCIKAMQMWKPLN